MFIISSFIYDGFNFPWAFLSRRNRVRQAVMDPCGSARQLTFAFRIKAINILDSWETICFSTETPLLGSCCYVTQFLAFSVQWFRRWWWTLYSRESEDGLETGDFWGNSWKFQEWFSATDLFLEREPTAFQGGQHKDDSIQSLLTERIHFIHLSPLLLELKVCNAAALNAR